VDTDERIYNSRRLGIDDLGPREFIVHRGELWVCKSANGPDCGDWCQWGGVEPDHMCEQVMYAHTFWHAYASSRGDSKRRRAYMETWPLPVGVCSVADWAESYGFAADDLSQEAELAFGIDLDGALNTYAGFFLHRLHSSRTASFGMTATMERVPEIPGCWEFSGPRWNVDMVGSPTLASKWIRDTQEQVYAWYERTLLEAV